MKFKIPNAMASTQNLLGNKFTSIQLKTTQKFTSLILPQIALQSCREQKNKVKNKLQLGKRIVF